MKNLLVIIIAMIIGVVSIFFILYRTEKFAYLDRPLQNKKHYANMSRTLGRWGEQENSFCYETERTPDGQCAAASLACGSKDSWDAYNICARDKYI